jgi:hypothetical protein
MKAKLASDDGKAHPCCAEQCDLSGILASRASPLAC